MSDQNVLCRSLHSDIKRLAEEIGERNTREYANLQEAASFITSTFQTVGLPVDRQTYEADGKSCQNIEAEIPGLEREDGIVIVGAHYDSIRGSPGANDNGSGVAALLAIARQLTGTPCRRTIRFVAFVNEEPPYVRTPGMGSLVYAERCRRRKERVFAMVSLETIGYHPSYDPPPSDPPLIRRLLRPLQGNFVAFVANLACRDVLGSAVTFFREASDFPVKSIVLPGFLPGVKSSDHWSFWRHGYPAFMVTDTAPFRYPFYHTAYDTPDKLSYAALAQIVIRLESMVSGLAGRASIGVTSS